MTIPATYIVDAIIKALDANTPEDRVKHEIALATNPRKVLKHLGDKEIAPVFEALPECTKEIALSAVECSHICSCGDIHIPDIPNTQQRERMIDVLASNPAKHTLCEWLEREHGVNAPDIGFDWEGARRFAPTFVAYIDKHELRETEVEDMSNTMLRGIVDAIKNDLPLCHFHCFKDSGGLSGRQVGNISRYAERELQAAEAIGVMYYLRHYLGKAEYTPRLLYPTANPVDLKRGSMVQLPRPAL